MNYKTGNIANQIIAAQNADGTWGNEFHSLSIPNNKKPWPKGSNATYPERLCLSKEYMRCVMLAEKQNFKEVYICA